MSVDVSSVVETPSQYSPAESTEGAPLGGAALRFRRGLPGFSESHRFSLVEWGGEGSPYSLLVDVDNPHLRFLVAPPAVFFPQYAAEIDDATVSELDLQSADEALLLVIITVTESAELATANLLGPIVINTRTREGAQAVLSESGYGTRVPLLSAA